MNYKDQKVKFKNKRLVCIDFGLKRCGIAVCDEFHITSSPRGLLIYNSAGFWNELINILLNEKPAAIIVGVPIRLDGLKTKLIEEIEKFIVELSVKSNLEVISYDESFSSKIATQTMIEIGIKKKKRSRKGSTDKIAACVILRDFLNEMDN